MGIFSKDIECPNCRNVVLKKDMLTIDAKKHDEDKMHKAEKMCRDCAMEKFYDALLNFKEPIALVEPISSEAYVLGDIDSLLKMNGQDGKESVKFANGFISTFPAEGTKCNRCVKEARFSWCESAVIFDDPYMWEFNYDAGYEHLCPECLVEAFKKALKENDIKIREAISIPVKGRGFMFSWEF